MQCKIENLDVAVRSLTTAEGLPLTSFAGQQQSFLNICGVQRLLNACKSCFASLFTNRTIVYRSENKFDLFKVYLSIGVQKMIRSDLVSTDVIFTLHTKTGFPAVVFITVVMALEKALYRVRSIPMSSISLNSRLDKDTNR